MHKRTKYRNCRSHYVIHRPYWHSKPAPEVGSFMRNMNIVTTSVVESFNYICFPLNANLVSCTLFIQKAVVRVTSHFDVTLKYKLHLYINNDAWEVHRRARRIAYLALKRTFFPLLFEIFTLKLLCSSSHPPVRRSTIVHDAQTVFSSVSRATARSLKSVSTHTFCALLPFIHHPIFTYYSSFYSVECLSAINCDVFWRF